MTPIKPIEELTFVDDYMFGYILQNESICKKLLERLLKIKIEKLEFPKLQKSISPFYESKGIRLDVYVKDSDKVFDIEIQNSINIDLPKRTRYYQSMVDIDSLLKGENYSTLKESFIIFICTFDPFNAGLPCYTFKNICLENKNLELKDKTSKIIYNSTAYIKEKDVEISAFLKYIDNRIPTDEFTKELSRLVKEAKINNKFRNDYLAMNLHDRDIKEQAFNEGLSSGIQRGIIQGILEGEHKKALETARNMLLKSIPKNIVADCTGLSLEIIEQLVKEQDMSSLV